jgi:hypothetical protein
MRVSRRRFVQTFSLLNVFRPAAWAQGREIACDVAIIGGGTGGCAAALAACRNGSRVVMTEETDWVGGQLTAQAVPPDEHKWIEERGATQAYRGFRQAIRRYYSNHYRLSETARKAKALNPGGGSVSRFTLEPKIALAVLESLLAPYVSAGQLTILREHVPVSAQTAGDRVLAVTVQSNVSGNPRILRAPYFLDATETGELLPLTQTEFVTGFESQRDTGEPHAPDEAQPRNHQACTVCFALGYDKAADHTIDKPAEYAFWRDYVPQLTPPWTGKLFDWLGPHPYTMKPRRVVFDPTQDSTHGNSLNLWIYRRIVRQKHFEPGACNGDVTLVNWSQNDYWLGTLYGGSKEENARHLRGGRQMSLSLVYWLQTEAPRPDGGAGWPGLYLRPDITGTEDGLAKYPYVRESRRIQAEFTVVEQHVGAEARKRGKGNTDRAEQFPDSVGVGSYRIDLHPSTGGDNYIDIPSLPFQIPLGALLPKRMENLLPAAKNIGVTHLTNGCYRLHPVEWNVGESAGMLAAFCLATGSTPRHVRNTAGRLREFQDKLTSQGVELSWYK